MFLSDGRKRQVHHLMGAHPILCEIEVSAGSAHRDGDVGRRRSKRAPRIDSAPIMEADPNVDTCDRVLLVVDRYCLRRECDPFKKQFSKRVGRSGIEVYDNFSATNLELLNHLGVAY